MAEETKQPETQEKEVKQTEEKQPETVDINDLSAEEILKLNENDPPPVKKDEAEKTEDEPGEKEETDETGDKEETEVENKTETDDDVETEESKDERVPVGYDDQGNPLYYNDKGQIVTGDKLKDTVAALNRTEAMLAEANKELEQLKIEAAEKKFDDFVLLSDAELKELKETEPDEAEIYVKDLAEYETHIEQRENHRKNTQYLVILNAAEEILREYEGFEGNIDPQVEFFKQPAEVQRFLIETLQKKIDPVITQRYKPNDDGLYTKEQIRSAYIELNLDKIVANKQKGVRQQTIQDIETAAGKTPVIEKIPKTAAKEGTKPFNELTYEEIQDLSPEEVEYYDKQT